MLEDILEETHRS